MAAEIKPRIDFNDRTRLETVIPLSTPYLVFLDPSDICNAHCAFCPTSNKELMLKTRKQQFMEENLYKRIINDLSGMPEPIKTLRLYGFGEPLLHPKFPEMVAYARKTARFLQIDTTTNGLLLKPELNMRLIDAGLDMLMISVPADYSPNYVKNVRHFYTSSEGQCQVYVKTIREEIGDRTALFLDDFVSISDRIFIENRINCWPNFNAGPDGVRGIYDQDISNTIAPTVCPYIFYSLTINSDGSVSACFLDWDRSMIVGDLKMQSISSIWNGAELYKMRLTHLLKHKHLYRSCAECAQLLYGAADNIDRYVEEIWKHI